MMNTNFLLIVLSVAVTTTTHVQAQISNDECGTSIVVSDGAPTIMGDNSLASAIDDAEASCASTSGFDAWYEYVASCSGQATVDTFGGGGHDTVLSVYDVCGGTEIACNDDFGGLESRVNFSVSQGESYFIRLASIGAGCPYVLNISCTGVPTNDDCIDATMVSDGIPAAEGDNSQADMADAAEASCQPNSNDDVWFEYTATCTGQTTVDTFGSGQEDTVLTVFDACDDGEEIGCNDDFGGLMSRVTFDSSAGQSYWLRLGSYGPGGDYDINITCSGEPGGGPCAPGSSPGDGDGDGDIDLADYARFAICMFGPGGSLPPDCACFDMDKDRDVDLRDGAELELNFTRN